MGEVISSKLAEVKTVFNSNADNQHYYDLLKNANCHNINNVELAKPVIRQANLTIIWKSEKNHPLIPFKELSEEKQKEIAFKLEEFFNVFKNKIKNLKNVSEDFADKIIQIPNLNSLFVNEDNDYIVITNWGFLEDSFNRKEDVIKNIFSKRAPSSILVKLLNKKSNPVSGVKLKLDSQSLRETDITDEKGFARMGTIEIGDDFSIYETKSFDDELLAEFKCDGRKEYEIQIDQDVKINLHFVDQYGSDVSLENYSIKIPKVGKIEFNTDENGLYTFTSEVLPDDFGVFDQNGNRIFSNEIPDKDSSFEIKIKIENEEEDKSPLSESGLQEEGENTTFKFINSFNRPIRNLNVSFEDSNKNKFSSSTNKNGEIRLSGINDSNITYSFTRYKKQWNNNISLKGGDYHIIKVRSIFPWFWWILITLLLLLLLCCFFFNCFNRDCNKSPIVNHPDNTSQNPVENLSENEKQRIEEEGLILCNATIESGGQGITRTKHYLGKNSGVVTIQYNMQHIPDKLEVYYENKLVASTFDIQDNIDGFVGEANNASCCGIIQFNYNKKNDDFCTVVVTGPNRTVWEYLINCPQ